MLLAGLLLLFFVLLASVWLFFDDDDYHDALVWSVQYFTDNSLEISGPFSLRVADEISLDAGGVRLAANDGSYHLQADEVSIRLRTGAYLKTGTFWVNSLVLNDAQVHVQESGTPAIDDFTLPPVIVEQAELHNLHLFYREKDQDKVHEVALLELILDDINNSGPVSLKGEGLLAGRPFSLEGTTDPLADLLDEHTSYGFRLALSSGTLAISAGGSLADPLRGRGMDVNLSITDPAFTETVKLFSDSVPPLGGLATQAQLLGDYTSPQLENVHVQLQRDEDFAVNLEGQVEDLSTGKGMNLRVTGHVHDPDVFAWLMPDVPVVVASASLEGTVQEKQGRYLINDMQAALKTGQGLAVHASGSTEIPVQGHARSGQSMALQVEFTAPDTQALNLAAIDGVPELGPVTGSFNLVPFLDGAEISKLSLAVGDKGNVYGSASGTVGFLPVENIQQASGIELDVKVAAVSSRRLGELLTLDVPDLGAVSANMHVTGDMNNLLVDRIVFNTGVPDNPTIRANGRATTRVKTNSSKIDAEFDVAAADLLAAFRELPPGYLGRLQGTMSLSDIDGSWGLDKFRLVSSNTSLYSLEFGGTYDDLLNRDEVEVRTRIVVDDPQAFGEALGVDLAGYASYRAEGVLSGSSSHLTYKGNARVGRTESTTLVSGSLGGKKPHFKGEFVMPVLYLEDFGVQVEDELPDIEAGKQVAGTPGEVLSRDALPFHYLKTANLDLSFDIEEVSGSRMSIDSLRAKLSLEDSLLKVKPFKLIFEGGPAVFEMEVDARNTPHVVLRGTADDLALGSMIAQVQKEVPVDGYANLNIDLQGSGHTPHDLASSLNGIFSIGLENARIPKSTLDLLAVDIFGWVFSSVRLQQPYARIDCMMAGFDVADGVATSNLLLADGRLVAIEGKATLDFRTETMNMVLLPKQKKSLFSTITPVKLTGPMNNPRVEALPVKAAAASAGTLYLIPHIAIPVKLLGKLWNVINDNDQYGNGCANVVLQQKGEAQEPVSEPQTQSYGDEFFEY